MSSKYSISQYTKDKANKLNVYVKISTNKDKKLDVFDKKNDKRVASIGARGMMDYQTYACKQKMKIVQVETCQIQT